MQEKDAEGDAKYFKFNGPPQYTKVQWDKKAAFVTINKSVSKTTIFIKKVVKKTHFWGAFWGLFFGSFFFTSFGGFIFGGVGFH